MVSQLDSCFLPLENQAERRPLFTTDLEFLFLRYQGPRSYIFSSDHSSRPARSSPPPSQITMSRLNAGAFEFVPGKSLKAPTQPLQEPAQQPAQSSLPSLDNLGPPQTISLNIGGSKPTPPPTPPVPQQSQPLKPPPPKSQTPTPRPDASPVPITTTVKLQTPSSNATSSKTFTLEKAKTDTTAISNELNIVADQDTLKDLFGDGMCGFERSSLFNI